MAQFVVVGAVAWDRPIYLDGHLRTGSRLQGETAPGARAVSPSDPLEQALPGRLGGGGATAAAALTLAGHEVAVISSVAKDEGGEAALESLRKLGVRTEWIVRTPPSGRLTLLLIDRDGERTVVHVSGARSQADETLPLAELETACHAAARWGCSGVFVRASFPGVEHVTARCTGPVIAHWPMKGPCHADVLVGSAADLGLRDDADPFLTGRAVADDRLRWVVVTEGASGARAYGGETAPSAHPVNAPGLATSVLDTTGAGDCFGAGLLDALGAGATMTDALRHAASWGANAVALRASAPLTPGPGMFAPYRVA